ncbi:MAG: citramalate synthase, partial [Planctomycetota bacterium]|nr:citramalate synthase [Planctomycetota bacterium]
VHVSAVLRNAGTYEHVDPAAVGNERRVLVSELSGRSNLLAVAGEKFGLADRPDRMRQVLDQIRRKEAQGYAYEAADASLEILIRKVLGTHRTFFRLLGFRVIVDVRQDGTEMCEGTIRIEVGSEQEHTASEGNGPVNALDGALRKALYRFYPELRDVTLVDYKVRVINAKAATRAKVLVHITSTDGRHRWTTVGASENILEASWIALVDSVEYKLMRERENGAAGKPGGTGGDATAG